MKKKKRLACSGTFCFMSLFSVDLLRKNCSAYFEKKRFLARKYNHLHEF